MPRPVHDATDIHASVARAIEDDILPDDEAPDTGTDVGPQAPGFGIGRQHVEGSIEALDHPIGASILSAAM
jgi:hypothetical protein